MRWRYNIRVAGGGVREEQGEFRAPFEDDVALIQASERWKTCSEYHTTLGDEKGEEVRAEPE